MEQQKDIFISYGRGNPNSPGSKAFTFALADKLQEQGYGVWLDKNDIPIATDYQEEIDKGIELSNNFLFIISPHAAKSAYCFKEIEKAVDLHKRIIPILHIPPSQEVVDESLHPSIKKLNWLAFDEEADQDKAFENLVSALQSDVEHLGQHTKYLYKAKEWEANNYRREFYLAGKELKTAESWLKDALDKGLAPDPTDLHRDYIKRSRRYLRTSRLVTFAASTALLLITTLSVLAGWYSYQEKVALEESFENLKLSKSNELLSSAFQIACDYTKKRSLPVVAMAYRTAPDNPKAIASFYSTYYNEFSGEEAQPAASLNFAPQLSPKGQKLTFEVGSGLIYLYGPGGEILGIIRADGKTITGLAYDEASQTLYAETATGGAIAYQLNIEDLIASFENKAVPEVSEDMLERYGIDKKIVQETGIQVEAAAAKPMDILSTDTVEIAQNMPDEPDPDPINQKTEELPEEVTGTQATDTEEARQPSPTKESEEAISFEALQQSTDIAALAKGWQYFYNQYQQNKGTDAGREMLQKAVKLAELASYQDRGNAKVMSILGKSSGELAWEYLLAGEPERAIYYSKQGMVVAPDQEWMLNNLLLGYLYNGQLPQALEVATVVANRPYVFSDRYPTFNDAILADLKELEAKGQISQQVAAIRKALFVPIKAGYVEINEGAQSVTSPQVNLRLFARGASEMMISNVPGFNDNAQWEPYQMTKKWKLVPSQGLKYVYAKFRNGQGEESETVQAKVNLLNIR